MLSLFSLKSVCVGGGEEKEPELLKLYNILVYKRPFIYGSDSFYFEPKRWSNVFFD